MLRLPWLGRPWPRHSSSTDHLARSEDAPRAGGFQLPPQRLLEKINGMDEPVARLATIAILRRAGRFLVERIAELEERIQGGDEGAWRLYCEAIRALTAVEECLIPGEHGEYLTTAEMAQRLGIAPKTLLRHKAAGTVKPALQRGKLIRWKGNEASR